MTAQLDLFATAEPVAARRLGHIHNIQLLRRPYQLRDDAEALGALRKTATGGYVAANTDLHSTIKGVA